MPNDWELPVQGPNSGLSAQAPPVPNVYEILDKFEQFYLNTTARNAGRRGEVDGIRQMARMGKSLEEIQADMEAGAVQTEMDKVAGELAQSTANLSDKEFQQVQEQISREMAGAPQEPTMQQAKPPNIWHSIIAAAASLYDPEHAFDIGEAPFKAQENIANQQNQLDLANYQIKDKAHDRRLGVLQRQSDDIRQRDQYQQTSLDRDQRSKMVYLQHLQTRMDKMDASRRERRLKLEQAYSAANLPGEKQQIAARIAQDFPDVAIPKEILDADIRALNFKNIPQAKALLDQSIKAKYADGIIDDADAANFEEQAQAIADQFGLPRSILGELPLDMNIQRETFEFAKKKFERQFTFLKEKQRKDLELKWANYQLSKRRVQQYEQSAKFNQAHTVYQDRLDEYDRSVEALQSTVGGFDPKDVKKLDQQIAGKEGFLRTPGISDAQKATAQAGLEELRAEREFLTGVKKIRMFGRDREYDMRDGQSPPINVPLPPAGNYTATPEEVRRSEQVLKGGLKGKGPGVQDPTPKKQRAKARANGSAVNRAKQRGFTIDG